MAPQRYYKGTNIECFSKKPPFIFVFFVFIRFFAKNFNLHYNYVSTMKQHKYCDYRSKTESNSNKLKNMLWLSLILYLV